MRLNVSGIKEIVITDPGKLCGHRKHLDQNRLQQMKGQDFTAKELKSMFGYAMTTALADTQLRNFVEPVNKAKFKLRGEPYAEKSTRWRIK